MNGQVWRIIESTLNEAISFDYSSLGSLEEAQRSLSAMQLPAAALLQAQEHSLFAQGQPPKLTTGAGVPHGTSFADAFSSPMAARAHPPSSQSANLQSPLGPSGARSLSFPSQSCSYLVNLA